jgi:hypothetical protein
MPVLKYVNDVNLTKSYVTLSGLIRLNLVPWKFNHLRVWEKDNAKATHLKEICDK